MGDGVWGLGALWFLILILILILISGSCAFDESSTALGEEWPWRSDAEHAAFCPGSTATSRTHSKRFAPPRHRSAASAPLRED